MEQTMMQMVPAQLAGTRFHNLTTLLPISRLGKPSSEYKINPDPSTVVHDSNSWGTIFSQTTGEILRAS